MAEPKLRLLGFQRAALAAVHGDAPESGSGLVVVGRGLGARRLLAAAAALAAHGSALVLIVASSASTHARAIISSSFSSESTDFDENVDGIDGDDVDGKSKRVAAANSSLGSAELIRPLVRCIASDTPPAARARVYLAGGIVAASAQLLVVDMLSGALPAHLVTGALVPDAHRVHAASLESFALRLLRDANRACFIRAFSDDPESLANPYTHRSDGPAAVVGSLERSLRSLHLRSIHLWPRFHVQVNASLDTLGAVDLVELRVPLSRRMKDIQAAILDCLHEILLDIKRSNPSIDTENLRIDHALVKSFDAVIRHQLDPVWHRVNPKTKQLVKDLHVLRQLLSHVLTYDCVSFYLLIETMLAANASVSASVSVFRSGVMESPWLMLDAAHTVFAAGRDRVYRKLAAPARVHHSLVDGIPPNIVPVLEEQPKWRALAQILREILDERVQNGNKGNILIMVTGDRACRQLYDIATSVVLGQHHSTKTPSKNVSDTSSTSSTTPSFSSAGSERVLLQSLKRYFTWKGRMSTVSKNMRAPQIATVTSSQPVTGAVSSDSSSVASSSSSAVVRPAMSQPVSDGRRAPPNKRRRVRGSSASAATSSVSSGLGRGSPLPDASAGLLTPAAFEAEADQIAEFLNDVDALDGSGDDEAVIETGSLDGDANTGSDNQSDSQTQQTVSGPPFVFLQPYAATSFSTTPSTSRSGGGVANTTDTETSPVKIITSSDTNTDDGDDDTGDLDDTQTLTRLKPKWIIMHDPDVSFIRRIEIHQAHHPHTRIKVYFIVYDNSVEEQRYLTSIRREKEAFEKLIEMKSTMVIAEDVYGRDAGDAERVESMMWRNRDTRRAGGSTTSMHPSMSAHPNRNNNNSGVFGLPREVVLGDQRRSDDAVVVIDVREFRSQLPSLVYARGMRIHPCTLQVGDYILSPRICVERKSIPDLVGSLKSGRLYYQCEAMSLHYKVPVLLIEFEHDRAFSLTPYGGGKSGYGVGTSALTMAAEAATAATAAAVAAATAATSMGVGVGSSGMNPERGGSTIDLNARLALLCLTFPKLRLIWSPSPATTAEIFHDLKLMEEEPDAATAISVGVDSETDKIDSVFHITPMDVLMALPGITTGNYRRVVASVRDVRELASKSLDEMQEMIGKENGARLHQFVTSSARDSPNGGVSSSNRGGSMAPRRGRGRGGANAAQGHRHRGVHRPTIK